MWARVLECGSVRVDEFKAKLEFAVEKQSTRVKMAVVVRVEGIRFEAEASKCLLCTLVVSVEDDLRPQTLSDKGEVELVLVREALRGGK